MARKGSRSLEKRSMYVNLDGLVGEVHPLINMSMASFSSNPLSSTQKSHKKLFDPNVPLHEYVVKSRAIGSMFYN